MVRLYSISVYYKTDPATALEKKAAYELSSFGFFNRSRCDLYAIIRNHTHLYITVFLQCKGVYGLHQRGTGTENQYWREEDSERAR